MRPLRGLDAFRDLAEARRRGRKEELRLEAAGPPTGHCASTRLLLRVRLQGALGRTTETVQVRLYWLRPGESCCSKGPMGRTLPGSVDRGGWAGKEGPKCRI